MSGTNHLGHLALPRWLLPLLSAAPAGRVVTTGSFAAETERLDLDDLQSRTDRVFGPRGRPRPEPGWSHLTDAPVAARLWAESVRLTGTEPATAPGPARSPPLTSPARGATR
ncbi:hypothetical protein [Streptomyces sp. NPDC090994]|uniref:hypothetical protein n=1 Tax=Streptomyces sp. NPDC090994 TaxID=3365969 RepID=UPI0038173B24